MRGKLMVWIDAIIHFRVCKLVTVNGGTTGIRIMRIGINRPALKITRVIEVWVVTWWKRSGMRNITMRGVGGD